MIARRVLAGTLVFASLPFTDLAVSTLTLLIAVRFVHGSALGPIVAGLLVAAVGYARMFQIMAAVAFIMAVAFVVMARRSPSAQSIR